jgi:hypothetical protein
MMEFFAELEKNELDIEALRGQLQIATLPVHCESIHTVISDNGNKGEIYCVWGQFTVSREPIRNGVRFALLNCPHALAWTVAYHAERKMLVVHCTIDDRTEADEFVESIEQFVSDWATGLGHVLRTRP